VRTFYRQVGRVMKFWRFCADIFYGGHQNDTCWFRLGCERRSLEQIHKFNCWLADLHKLDFFTSETPSQTHIAIMHTPHRPLGKSSCSRQRDEIVSGITLYCFNVCLIVLFILLSRESDGCAII